MASMNTRAEHLDSPLDSPLDSRIESRLDSQVGPNKTITLGEQAVEPVKYGVQQISASLTELLASPNLRAAVAVGFFLAYLATALT